MKNRLLEEAIGPPPPDPLEGLPPIQPAWENVEKSVSPGAEKAPGLPPPEWEMELFDQTPGWFGLFPDVCLKLVLVAAIATVPALRYLDLQTRVASSIQEIQALKGKRSSLEQRLKTAESSGVDTASLSNQRQLLGLDLHSSRWSQTLQMIAENAESGVDLTDIQVRGQADETGLSEVRITGVCEAPEPRTAAESFRRSLEVKLGPEFAPAKVKARFASLTEDPSPATGPSGRRKASFSILIREGTSKAMAAEGRLP